MNCQILGGVSHRTCKQVLLAVGFELVERSKALIFFSVPPHLQSAEGGGSVKGGKRNS
jgi:hypothetical protein